MNDMKSDGHLSSSDEENEEDISTNMAISGDQSRKIKETLPIYRYKKEIIEAVQKHQFTVVLGETGSGKTTQLPQLLLDGLAEVQFVAVTQPRRLAAVSTARRVAAERRVVLGSEVGYEVRFEHEVSAGTRIKFMTEGVLLAEMLGDPWLAQYQLVIVDEAHERSLTADILVGLLRSVCKDKHALKVVLVSATIDVTRFRAFLGPDECAIVNVKGRVYPIEFVYTGFHTDYVRLAAETVRNIIQDPAEAESERGPVGDVLVFMPGEEEITKCCQFLRKVAKQTQTKLMIVPLHGGLAFLEQKVVFQAAPDCQRKIVVATNIAETSITIPGIRYVVDGGYMKQSRYDSRRGMESLELVAISKSHAKQRAGRAGRTEGGVCFRLYSEEMFNDKPDDLPPEILRQHLTEVFLKLVFLKINPHTFEFLEKPAEEELERCNADLLELAILKADMTLTKRGEVVAQLPVEPRCGLALVSSLEYGCSREVVAMVAAFAERFSLFRRPTNRIKEAETRRRDKFDERNGDHFSILRVCTEFDKIPPNRQREWCYANFVDHITLQRISKIRSQLEKLLTKKFRIKLASSTNPEPVKKSFVTAFYRNICIKDPYSSVYRRVSDSATFYIHPSSSMFSVDPKIVLFHEVKRTSRQYIHGVMSLDERLLRSHFKHQLKQIEFPDNVEDFFKNPFN